MLIQGRVFTLPFLLMLVDEADDQTGFNDCGV